MARAATALRSRPGVAAVVRGSRRGEYIIAAVRVMFATDRAQMAALIGCIGPSGT